MYNNQKMETNTSTDAKNSAVKLPFLTEIEDRLKAITSNNHNILSELESKLNGVIDRRTLAEDTSGIKSDNVQAKTDQATRIASMVNVLEMQGAWFNNILGHLNEIL